MYFKRLEIFGFKSFGDKTAMNFEPGITAIVGPNGCGKSNVFDSIRWVLGEQSVKELRGSSMEDVIFNGTDKKPALGFAEVSLSFSNESRMLPVDEDEVMISRRLFRSGESEYLINKQTVRLRDIQEMLMGTGIGAEAYSLIQQGKVDLVVSARPEDRRMIFDEAAGITKYKSKKKEALNKLKDTENNLLRVNDIVQEVKRQIASIERQANKARRYKDEYEKLKQLEVKLAQKQIGNFGNSKDEIKNALDHLKEQEGRLCAQLEELNASLAHEGDLLAELEQGIHDVKEEDIRLGNQIDMDIRQIGFNEEKIENLKANEQRLSQQKQQLLERCRSQQEKLEEVKKDLNNIKTVLEEKSQALSDKRYELQCVADSIREAKAVIREDEDKILAVSSRQVHIKNELTEAMKELQGALARKRRLDIEYTKVSSEKEEIDRKLQDTEAQIEQALSKVRALKEQKESMLNVLNDSKAKLAQLDATIAELEKKRFFLKSQKEFIEELRVQYQDMPDPVVEGRLLTRTPPQEHHSGIIGKVKGVTPGVDGMYEIACETKFIELDPQQVTARIETIGQEIETYLRQKEEIVARIQQEQLALQSLEESIHAEERSLSIFEAQKKDVLEESSKISGELELVETELHEVKETLTSVKTKEEELAQKLDESEQQLQGCRDNIKHQQELIATKSQSREEATVTIAQIETEIESITDKARTLNENFEMFRENLSGSHEEVSKIDAEILEQQDKGQKVLEQIEALKVQIVSLKEKKESLKGVLEDNARKKAEVSQKINSLKAGIVAADKEIAQIHEQLHSEAFKEQELTYNEKGIKDRLFQTYKIEYDQVVAELEAQKQQWQAENPDQPPQPELSEEEMTQELERVKKRCDSFGSVNLVAIEEYEELKQRYEFLNKQQEDLLAAKESLHQTINKINRTTRQLFMETFTKVGEAFRIYFRMLFGGGEAQLVLLDPDNVLESGIEIVARPPGKKLQNISLLSGGEKTMTAIALIFGVFKVRPSPFCVLDEIDAALDESNVGRFSYLLKDFAKIAQFIVVTHNKKTIAHADVMYGITMQETGVSKVVSVKLSDKEKKEVTQEAAVAA